MKIQYSSTLIIMVGVLLVFGSPTYAQDISQFNHMIQVVEAHRARVEVQLGIDPNLHRLPQATSYYDDKEAHYELAQIRSDEIDKGIR